MKISDIHSKNNLLENVGQANSSQTSEKSQKAGTSETRMGAGDRVEFSAQSREMQKIRDILEATPEVRAEKVAALKKQIEEGTYEVKSDALADKMLYETIMELIV